MYLYLRKGKVNVKRLRSKGCEDQGGKGGIFEYAHAKGGVKRGEGER